MFDPVALHHKCAAIRFLISLPVNLSSERVTPGSKKVLNQILEPGRAVIQLILLINIAERSPVLCEPPETPELRLALAAADSDSVRAVAR